MRFVPQNIQQSPAELPESSIQGTNGSAGFFIKNMQTPKEEKRARFKALVKQVSAMSDIEKAQFTNQIGAVVNADGHALSLTNTILLIMQCRNVSIVGGFKQWLAHGRCVRKGSHGYNIWFPAGPAKTKTDETSGSEETDGATRFFVATVFDISQTEDLNQLQLLA